MRYTLTLMGALLATTAQADEFLMRADVTAATVFLNGVAEIERQVSVAVPAGAHEVLFAVAPGVWMEAPQVTGTGDARIGALSVEDGYRIEEGALDSEDVAAARAVIVEIEGDIDALEAEIAEASAAVQAAALQRRYLEGVTAGGDNAAPFPSDPDLLAQMLTTLGAQMALVADAARRAEAARNDLIDDLRERQGDLADAQAALAALLPFGEQVRVVRVPVVAASDTVLNLSLIHFSTGANWRPEAQFRLDSDAGEVTVSRDIVLSQNSAERWRDVAVAVSTADPARPRAPVEVASRPARIMDPTAPRVTGGVGLFSADQAPVAEFAEPIMPVVDTAAIQTVGASFTYSFTDPVSIAPQESSRQAMAPLVFEVALSNQANPRRDDTAFSMAVLENDSGEPILPGLATFYRDGELLGDGFVDLVADGASVDLAFGALDHLLLAWRDLSLDEGEEGVFSRSNTQARSVEFSVENTSDGPEELRLLYALPFAEQEELEVDLDLSLEPDARDVDGARGVAAWDLTLAPGARRTIRMDVEFSWPEGQVLVWTP